MAGAEFSSSLPGGIWRMRCSASAARLSLPAWVSSSPKLWR